MVNRDVDKILIGRIVGLFGVKGWVKVFSYTQPRDNIVTYNPWYLKTEAGWQRFMLQQGSSHGKGIIAKLDAIDDRDAAAALLHMEIGIEADQLAELPAGEFYWSQLIGLDVINLAGQPLGIVDDMLQTGANDVLVVKSEQQERLIPYIRDQVIKQVDLDNGILQVDWEADY